MSLHGRADRDGLWVALDRALEGAVRAELRAQGIVMPALSIETLEGDQVETFVDEPVRPRPRPRSA